MQVRSLMQFPSVLFLATGIISTSLPAKADLGNDAGGAPVQDLKFQSEAKKKDLPRAMVLGSAGFSIISYDGGNDERLRELKNNGATRRLSAGLQAAYLIPIQDRKLWIGPSLALFPDRISNDYQFSQVFHWGGFFSVLFPMAQELFHGISARLDLGAGASHTWASSGPDSPAIRFQGGLGFASQIGLTWFLPASNEMGIGPGVSYGYYKYSGDTYSQIGFLKIDFAFLLK